MDYPSDFIRGIPNENSIENGFPKSDLFKNFDVNPRRQDGYKELSINWSDDTKALQAIFDQKKAESDVYQFSVGGAVLPTKEMEKLCKKPQIMDNLSFERSPLPDNKYHGNLLLKATASKGLRDMVASGLALSVTSVERRKSE